jgi:hypothetical protein
MRSIDNEEASSLNESYSAIALKRREMWQWRRL